MTDIDGNHTACTALQQQLGKAAGRGADVKGEPARDIDAEMIEGVFRLRGGARYIGSSLIADHDGRARRYLPRRLRHADAVDLDGAAQDGIAGAGAGLEEAALDEVNVEARVAAAMLIHPAHPLSAARFQKGCRRHEKLFS